jgi:hypothetical protein
MSEKPAKSLFIKTLKPLENKRESIVIGYLDEQNLENYLPLEQKVEKNLEKIFFGIPKEFLPTFTLNTVIDTIKNKDGMENKLFFLWIEIFQNIIKKSPDDLNKFRNILYTNLKIDLSEEIKENIINIWPVLIKHKIIPLPERTYARKEKSDHTDYKSLIQISKKENLGTRRLSNIESNIRGSLGHNVEKTLERIELFKKQILNL